MVQLSHAVLLYKAHNIHRDERITFVTAPVLDPLSHLNTKLLVRCVGFSNGRAKESFPSHQLQNALRVYNTGVNVKMMQLWTYLGQKTFD